MTHLTVRLLGAATMAALLLPGLPVPAQQKPPADPDKAYQHRYILLQSLHANAALAPTQVTFDHLPPGTYVVCSIHDSNGNNKLDGNFLGIPREDWAVSNDARPRF